jgi:hypothetical protein
LPVGALLAIRIIGFNCGITRWKKVYQAKKHFTQATINFSCLETLFSCTETLFSCAKTVFSRTENYFSGAEKVIAHAEKSIPCTENYFPGPPGDFLPMEKPLPSMKKEFMRLKNFRYSQNSIHYKPRNPLIAHPCAQGFKTTVRRSCCAVNKASRIAKH